MSYLLRNKHDFSMQLLGLTEGTPVFLRAEISSGQPRPSQVDVSGAQCVEKECRNRAASDRGNGWLCPYHQGRLERQSPGTQPATDPDTAVVEQIIAHETREIARLRRP